MLCELLCRTNAAIAQLFIRFALMDAGVVLCYRLTEEEAAAKRAANTTAKRESRARDAANKTE